MTPDHVAGIATRLEVAIAGLPASPKRTRVLNLCDEIVTAAGVQPEKDASNSPESGGNVTAEPHNPVTLQAGVSAGYYVTPEEFARMRDAAVARRDGR